MIIVQKKTLSFPPLWYVSNVW